MTAGKPCSPPPGTTCATDVKPKLRVRIPVNSPCVTSASPVYWESQVTATEMKGLTVTLPILDPFLINDGRIRRHGFHLMEGMPEEIYDSERFDEGCTGAWKQRPNLLASCRIARALSGPGTALYEKEWAPCGGISYEDNKTVEWDQAIFEDDTRWSHSGTYTVDGLVVTFWEVVHAEVEGCGVFLIHDLDANTVTAGYWNPDLI